MVFVTIGQNEVHRQANYPIISCFGNNTTVIQNEGEGLELVNSIRIKLCPDVDLCPRRIRICSENESTNDVLFYLVVPAVLFLHLLSVTSSILLQKLGNYLTMYNWSKVLPGCCSFQIIHNRYQ